MAMTPHVRCAECDQVFAADAGMDDEVTCPHCGHQGKPGGIMRPTGFPSMETFRRNISKARGERGDD